MDIDKPGTPVASPILAQPSPLQRSLEPSPLRPPPPLAAAAMPLVAAAAAKVAALAQARGKAQQPTVSQASRAPAQQATVLPAQPVRPQPELPTASPPAAEQHLAKRAKASQQQQQARKASSKQQPQAAAPGKQQPQVAAPGRQQPQAAVPGKQQPAAAPGKRQHLAATAPSKQQQRKQQPAGELAGSRGQPSAGAAAQPAVKPTNALVAHLQATLTASRPLSVWPALAALLPAASGPAASGAHPLACIALERLLPVVVRTGLERAAAQAQPGTPAAPPQGRYASVLRALRSARLSATWAVVVGSPITSASYAHAIDPHWPLCPFDVRGSCQDVRCCRQHWVDLQLGASEAQDEVARLMQRAGLPPADRIVQHWAAHELPKKQQRLRKQQQGQQQQGGSAGAASGQQEAGAGASAAGAAAAGPAVLESVGELLRGAPPSKLRVLFRAALAAGAGGLPARRKAGGRCVDSGVKAAAEDVLVPAYAPACAAAFGAPCSHSQLHHSRQGSSGHAAPPIASRPALLQLAALPPPHPWQARPLGFGAPLSGLDYVTLTPTVPADGAAAAAPGRAPAPRAQLWRYFHSHSGAQEGQQAAAAAADAGASAAGMGADAGAAAATADVDSEAAAAEAAAAAAAEAAAAALHVGAVSGTGGAPASVEACISQVITCLEGRQEAPGSSGSGGAASATLAAAGSRGALDAALRTLAAGLAAHKDSAALWQLYTALLARRVGFGKPLRVLASKALTYQPHSYQLWVQLASLQASWVDAAHMLQRAVRALAGAPGEQPARAACVTDCALRLVRLLCSAGATQQLHAWCEQLAALAAQGQQQQEEQPQPEGQGAGDTDQESGAAFAPCPHALAALLRVLRAAPGEACVLWLSLQHAVVCGQLPPQVAQRLGYPQAPLVLRWDSAAAAAAPAAAWSAAAALQRAACNAGSDGATLGVLGGWRRFAQEQQALAAWAGAALTTSGILLDMRPGVRGMPATTSTTASSNGPEEAVRAGGSDACSAASSSNGSESSSSDWVQLLVHTLPETNPPCKAPPAPPTTAQRWKELAQAAFAHAAELSRAPAVWLVQVALPLHAGSAWLQPAAVPRWWCNAVRAVQQQPLLVQQPAAVLCVCVAAVASSGGAAAAGANEARKLAAVRELLAACAPASAGQGSGTLEACMRCLVAAAAAALAGDWQQAGEQVAAAVDAAPGAPPLLQASLWRQCLLLLAAAAAAVPATTRAAETLAAAALAAVHTDERQRLLPLEMPAAPEEQLPHTLRAPALAPDAEVLDAVNEMLTALPRRQVGCRAAHMLEGGGCLWELSVLKSQRRYIENEGLRETDGVRGS